MVKDWALIVLLLTVWAYWATVGVLIVCKRLRHGFGAGVVPHRRPEKRLWLGLVPVVVAWIVLPALAVVWRHGLFATPIWAVAAAPVYALRCTAAALAVASYLATLPCWLRMGRNWSIAIVPGQQTDLVTGGLFGWVRHPIYALSILLIICSAVVVCNVPMVLVAAVHVVLINAKATLEERHMTERHGPSYGAYCERVGRFVPRSGKLVGR